MSSKSDFELLMDSMERNRMRLVCRDRKMEVEIKYGKYEYLVMEYFRKIYRGNDFYQAMLALEGEE